VGVVSDIERQLARLRAREAADGMPQLRTSTMTHIVWCPPEWLAKARATLAGLLERHPARTIFLIPDPGSRTKIEARAELKDFHLQGLSREILSEVIELRLRGAGALHPGSIVLPLLVSDLPVFCRWRGEPTWGSSELEEIVGVTDRLVVDSSEWRGVPAAYSLLAALFDRVAVSDIAFSRTLPWRRRLAELWPEVGKIERLRVEGPRADAELVAGWLRARLRRRVALTRRDAAVVTAIWVDGTPVASPGEPLSPSDLLSAELDQFGRDPVYEAAVRAVVPRSG
jgi:glucose-6-phosphate dehydrogenase assembly protein OpcA